MKSEINYITVSPIDLSLAYEIPIDLTLELPLSKSS